MTSTNKDTMRQAEKLIHAALNVVAPEDRCQYLRGFIEGYNKAIEQQATDKRRTA